MFLTAVAIYIDWSYRSRWDADLLNFLLEKQKVKPVFLNGDLNVAHQAIDLKNPKSNYNKTPGYTQKEIDGMDNFLKAGYIDTFRELHPEEVNTLGGVIDSIQEQETLDGDWTIFWHLKMLKIWLQKHLF